jgi:hypothetical protein
MLIDTTRLDEVDFNALPGDELFRLFGRVNEVVWQARRTIENEAARACVLTTYEMEDDDDIVVHDDAVEFSYQDRERYGSSFSVPLVLLAHPYSDLYEYFLARKVTERRLEEQRREEEELRTRNMIEQRERKQLAELQAKYAQ